MPTLILSPRYTPDSIALRTAALLAGWRVMRLAGWRTPAGFVVEEPVLYGEPLFAAVVAEALSLALLAPPLDWLAGLPEELRRREVRYTTLREARKETRRTFIKPADDKCFPAAVYDSGRELPPDDVLPGETPVLLAEPVVWEVEFRFFVLEGEIRASSPYLRAGSLAQREDGSWDAPEEELQEALAFGREVLQHQEIPPALVMDVGYIQGRGWAVVEANPAWGSGLYGCAPSEVLKVLRRTSVPRAALLPGDLRWVLAP